MQYVIRLKQASKTLYEIIVKDTTTFLWEINHLNPEPYSIEVIHYFNRNGKWDALNYWQKLQAEKYRNFPLEKLKENWTFETELNILK